MLMSRSARSPPSRCSGGTVLSAPRSVLGLAALVKIVALFAAPVVVVVLLASAAGATRSLHGRDRRADVGRAVRGAVVVHVGRPRDSRHHLARLAVAARRGEPAGLARYGFRTGSGRRGDRHRRDRETQSSYGRFGPADRARTRGVHDRGRLHLAVVRGVEHAGGRDVVSPLRRGADCATRGDRPRGVSGGYRLGGASVDCLRSCSRSLPLRSSSSWS